MKSVAYIYTNYDKAEYTGQAGLMWLVEKQAKKSKYSTFTISNSLKTKKVKKTKNVLLIPGPGDFITYIRKINLIRQYIKEKNIEIIHIHGLLLYLMCFPSLVFTGIKVQWVVTLSETLQQFNALYLFLAKCLLPLAKISVSSNFIKEELSQLGIKDVQVIRVGLKPDYYKPRAILKNKFKYDLVFFGDASYQRGFDIIVKIIKQFPDYKILILLRKMNNDLLDEHELATFNPLTKIMYYPYKVSFVSLVRSAPIVLLPYRFMSMRPPISIIESMALGQVLITSTLPGNKELIQNNIDGYVLPLVNIKKWYTTINHLMRSAKKREQIALAARNKILKIFNKSEYQKVYNLYE